MNLLAPIGRFFLRLSALLLKALKSAQARGLTDAVIEKALEYVRAAADRYTENDARREWAAGMLASRLGIPDSVARLAVEIAVQIWKAETRRKENVS